MNVDVGGGSMDKEINYWKDRYIEAVKRQLHLEDLLKEAYREIPTQKKRRKKHGRKKKSKSK